MPLPFRTLSAAASFLFASALFPTAASAEFAFGIYPENNATRDVVAIEEEYGVRSTAVGYVFDGFSPSDALALRQAVATLGKDRIYHVTVSPLGLSAAEVADGGFDGEYSRFFETAKATGAKFVFRTMHEMNGSWFSWSGDPASFKKAWIRAYGLSRKAGLGPSDVLFSFSVNSQDLPSADGKVGGEMKFCTPQVRKKTGCLAFEDYYPGSGYADLVGVSVYNSGRARPETWSSWQTFAQILDDPRMDAYRRMKALGKPLFVDETATTAVNFEGEWSDAKAMERYRNATDDKNAWISGMAATIAGRPEIVGALYFNRDRTRGLTDSSAPGELDWAALPPESPKAYRAILDVFPKSGTGSVPFAAARVAKPDAPAPVRPSPSASSPKSAAKDPLVLRGEAVASGIVRKADRAFAKDPALRKRKLEAVLGLLRAKRAAISDPSLRKILDAAIPVLEKAAKR